MEYQPASEFSTKIDGIAPLQETWTALQRVQWATTRFGSKLSLTCSFQEIVLLDVVSKVAPDAQVVFIDTGSHFPQTLEFVDTVTRHYDLNLTVTAQHPNAAAHPCGSAQCCQYRKTLPLSQALAGQAAWMTGVKRLDSPTRSATPTVAWDPKWEVVKLCPLADWTDSDLRAYDELNDLPTHPLRGQGYGSIGCEPTTQVPLTSSDSRSGRWAGSEKVECGLHV
jgi:phosphoadenosine phosphosulfate reductase